MHPIANLQPVEYALLDTAQLEHVVLLLRPFYRVARFCRDLLPSLGVRRQLSVSEEGLIGDAVVTSILSFVEVITVLQPLPEVSHCLCVSLLCRPDVVRVIHVELTKEGSGMRGNLLTNRTIIVHYPLPVFIGDFITVIRHWGIVLLSSLLDLDAMLIRASCKCPTEFRFG